MNPHATGTPAPHPLDTAVQLQPLGQATEGRFRGHTSPAYANMIGPFGGITAATLLQAAMQHPARLGEPLALTVNYAGAVADGPFEISAQPVRTNRSTQHWVLTQSQGDEVCSTATLVCATQRSTWSATELGFPGAPAVDSLPPPSGHRGPAWTRNYDMRFVRGPFPDLSQGDEQPESTTTVWVRDEPPRTLDFVALAALCDVFFPRVYLRRRKFTPAGTVSFTVYFRADSATLAAQGGRSLLAQARGHHFGGGFFDQAADLWSPDGVLLATSHQVVYFKE